MAFLPKVRVFRSGIHGYGVRAVEAIEAGELVSEVEGVLRRIGDVADDTYCLFLDDEHLWDMADQTRWINHSCRPNARVEAGFDRERGGWARIVAVRRIEPGEEIAYHYGFPARLAEPCHCRNPGCPGWIVDPDVSAVLPLRREDLGEALDLARQVEPGGGWDEERIEAELTDRARGGGERSRVVRQGGALRGAAGFVDVGQADGRYYGSPVLAADPEAAEGLVAWLVAEARARRAGSLRISCGAGEGEAAKRGALLAAGFREIFRFLDLGVEVSDASHPPAPPQGYSVAGLATLPASDLAELASECFAAVENSPPMRCEDAEELLSGGRLLVAASEVVRDASGRPVGYLLATPDGWVDAVGVRSAARGLGLGRMLVARFLAAARGRGIPRVRARIASNNAASLRLHLGLGFVEDSSRAVLELRF